MKAPLLTFAVMVCLLCSTCLPASQESPPKAAQSIAPNSQPNSAGALRALLSDLLIAAKNDDQSKIWSKIAELEIPDYENWFTRTYGQGKGQALAIEYRKGLKTSEDRFEMLCVELAKQEGEISISTLDTANRKYQTVKSDDSLANATGAFIANWKKTDASAGPSNQRIGAFSFVDGKFRLQPSPSSIEVYIISPVKPGPVVPGKLIDRVQPTYPEAARKLRIRGMVSLNVVVHKDGTVTVENVGAGHPLLVPAALAAVQQWKYQPTTINGEPVDVETKIYVTFDLGEQKQ